MRTADNKIMPDVGSTLPRRRAAQAVLLNEISCSTELASQHRPDIPPVLVDEYASLAKKKRCSKKKREVLVRQHDGRILNSKDEIYLMQDDGSLKREQDGLVIVKKEPDTPSSTEDDDDIESPWKVDVKPTDLWTPPTVPEETL